MSSLQGVRGATTADVNSKEAILESTTELLQELVKANRIEIPDIAAVHFTATDDLNAEYPALAARQMGWVTTALMCSREISVPGSVTLCIRVLILLNTDKPAKEIKFVYMKGASNLRNRGMEKPGD